MDMAVVAAFGGHSHIDEAFLRPFSNVPTAERAAQRRLISLICAGWLPHDKDSSWSCLGLVSRVIPLPDAS